jgi:hypothetical protein
VFDPDDLSDDLGFTYMVWVNGTKVAAVRTFSGAVQISDLYRLKGFVDVVVDAEKKSNRDSLKENSNG